MAVMGCVVNGPGESKHADIGISLPGTFEEPVAPVFVDGALRDDAPRGGARGRVHRHPRGLCRAPIWRPGRTARLMARRRAIGGGDAPAGGSAVDHAAVSTWLHGLRIVRS